MRHNRREGSYIVNRIRMSHLSPKSKTMATPPSKGSLHVTMAFVHDIRSCQHGSHTCIDTDVSCSRSLRHIEPQAQATGRPVGFLIVAVLLELVWAYIYAARGHHHEPADMGQDCESSTYKCIREAWDMVCMLCATMARR